PPADLVTAMSGTAGIVEFSDGEGSASNSFKAYSTGASNGTGVADLDMFNSLGKDHSVVWKEYYNETGGKKGVLLRGSGDHGSCPYAEGMKQGYLFIAQNNNDNTATLTTYVADSEGLQ